ncbi:MAG: fibrobacter succinogenes major paralogous domain-containing protein [Candidatus Nomurabacteria bacterium]|jgi:uncharacterized protein (TIGR02145 family)|nr:fibrobacter succinogenes major paralogous domain-containing protein [Candidatus Nomurabacteria bacterium]
MSKKAITTITNFIKSHFRPLILSGLVLVFISLFFINYSFTHADASITLTINGGPTNNGKVITIDKNDCTTFTLDTTTTTDNTTGYNLKAYTKTKSTGITIKKQDNTDLPTNPNHPTEIVTTTKAEIKDKQTTTYQACAEESISDGDKTAEVAYVIAENLPSMQVFTLSDCQNLPIYNKTNPDPASTITLIDSRNSQEYDIRRLQDGKCWMIDNLKLELKNGMTLTTQDTNVENDTTIYFTQDGTQNGTKLTGMTENFTTSGYLTRDGKQPSSDYNWDAWRQVNPSSRTYCAYPSGAAYTTTNSKTGCGYLYNFYTATASFGTQDLDVQGEQVEDSICPAGWHLSRSGEIGALTNETDILNAKMAGFADNQDTTYQSNSTTYYANWISSGSWRGVLAGDYRSSFMSTGSIGEFWSSTIGYGSTSAYHIYLVSASSYANPNNTSSRYYAFGVRCLAN